MIALIRLAVAIGIIAPAARIIAEQPKEARQRLASINRDLARTL